MVVVVGGKKAQTINKRNVYRGKTRRRFLVDLWDQIAYSKKINRVNKRIYYSYAARLKKFLRAFVYAKKTYKVGYDMHIARIWAKQLPKLPLKMSHKGRRPRQRSAVGDALKVRRKLSLYLNAGRIGHKTMRRISKWGRTHVQNKVSTLLEPIARDNIINNKFFRYATSKYQNTTAILESRLDSLLVRSHFVRSVFQAREFIKHGRAIVAGRVVTYPVM
jgi:ribosomal protein S4